MSTAWIHQWRCLNCGIIAAALLPTEYWRPSICPDCKVAFGAVVIFKAKEVREEDLDLSQGLPVLTKETA